MNVVFGEIDLERPTSEYWRPRKGNELAFARKHVPKSTVQFASENASKIKREVESLSSENSLCSMLSGAAYNISYARYVQAGGKRSIFSNPFLAYIRTLYSLEHADFQMKTHQKISGLGEDILRPIGAMLHFMILRPFPHNPDERAYCNSVHNFVVEMQKVNAAASERKSKQLEAGRGGQENQKIRKKPESEYPTEQQVCEMYDAYQSGKPGALAEVLRKRKEERDEAEAQNPKVADNE